MSDTIFALSSGPLPAGVAVLRISGPSCRTICSALAGGVPPARVASVRDLRDPHSRDLLDRGLVLWFPAPHSFTGEDVVELHVHGSRAVLAALLAWLGRQPDCRLAEAGEFTRRAFLAGKMDLTEAEGLADLLAAQTEAQRRQALGQATGSLSRVAARWRLELLDLMASLAAALDFADEAEVEGLAGLDLAGRAHALADHIAAVLREAEHGEILREGATVVLAGPPNAGKSSLLNALARRDVALVSPHAGTTRDAIEVSLDLRGLPVVVVDTAGLRETLDPVERMGIGRTQARAAKADLVLWLSETGEAPPSDLEGAIRLRTKADLPGASHADDLAVSARTGQGMDALLDLLHGRVLALTGGAEPALVTQARQKLFLRQALEVLTSIRQDMEPEIIAEQLRRASRALDGLIGRIDVEEVLGAVFSRFCIGK